MSQSFQDGRAEMVEIRETLEAAIWSNAIASLSPILEAAGISFDHETVLIFCNLATWNETNLTFRHRSPYFGSWNQESGLCFAVDWANQNLTNLVLTMPFLKDAEYGYMSLEKHTTIFIGGIAHELGHAFALPHCGERWNEKSLGISLMGGGNHTYREEVRKAGRGSFLTMASAMLLAGRPLFSGSDKEEALRGELLQCTVNLSTNITSAELAKRHGALRVEGIVEGKPPIYGVVAYFDCIHDGGYQSPTATSVPDSQGQFAIEISGLSACGDGILNIDFCHANGAVSKRQYGFSVTSDGCVDLSQWEMRRALEPVAESVANNQTKTAQETLLKLELTQVPELTKLIARKLVSTLADDKRATPATVDPSITRLPLGDANPKEAKVGWLKPAANRIPQNDEITSPFLDSGKIYATGLYAHAPSRYVFDLGGKWKKLQGQGGLHTVHQEHGSVVFVIKADGKEIFRSSVIQNSKKASYDLTIERVETLELIIEKAAQNNGGNWGLWLDPTLSR